MAPNQSVAQNESLHETVNSDVNLALSSYFDLPKQERFQYGINRVAYHIQKLLAPTDAEGNPKKDEILNSDKEIAHFLLDIFFITDDDGNSRINQDEFLTFFGTFRGVQIKNRNNEKVLGFDYALGHYLSFKRAYNQLYKEIEEILFRHNPMSINFEVNEDEYSPVVGTIQSNLTFAHSKADVLDIVLEEFKKCFDIETSNKQEDPVFNAIAKEIWSAWQKFKR